MAKAKQKAKRYTAEQKQEILDFIEKEGRGGQTKAVTKFKVTAATIAAWKRQAGGINLSSGKSSGGSKELRALEELAALWKEIETTEKRLASLQKAYQKARTKI